MKRIDSDIEDILIDTVWNTPHHQVLRALGLFLILASFVFGCLVLFCVYIEYSIGKPIGALVTVLGLLGMTFVTGIGLRGFRKWARVTATLLVVLLLLALLAGAVLKGIQDLEFSIITGACAVVCLCVLWSPSANKLFNAKSKANVSTDPHGDEPGELEPKP